MPALRGKKLAEEILRQADRLEGKFRTAYLRSVLKLADDKELKKLLDDIDKGRFSFGDSVDARLNSVRIDVAEMNEIARQAIAGSAKITNQVMGLKGSFDVVNDSVIDAAKKLSVELSTNLTKTAKASLRQIIEDQLSGNISRQEAVRRITMEVGLLPQHAKAVSNYRKTLISAGTPRGQANRMAEQYAKRLLKYRANMIARTEVARATGIGQTNFWRQMRDQGALPPSTNRVWITAMDERACEFCRSMNGEVATIDGGWETPKGYMEYPQASHPHCRCSSGITTSRPTKSGRAGRIAKVEELEYDLWLSKVGDKPGHPFRGNQYTQANKHAKEIDKKLRTVAGDKVADTWKPLVQEAMTTWYGQGDIQAPITVKGKKILVGGREISAQGVLDTMADALGVKAISQGRGFGADDVFSKGDKPGHPFRGNQWTGGSRSRVPFRTEGLYPYSTKNPSTPLVRTIDSHQEELGKVTSELANNAYRRGFMMGGNGAEAYRKVITNTATKVSEKDSPSDYYRRHKSGLEAVAQADTSMKTAVSRMLTELEMSKPIELGTREFDSETNIRTTLLGGTPPRLSTRPKQKGPREGVTRNPRFVTTGRKAKRNSQSGKKSANRPQPAQKPPKRQGGERGTNMGRPMPKDARGNLIIGKGDYVGHPFRGNQWTKGGGSKAPINWDSLYGDGIGGFMPDVREELEAYLTPTAIDSLEGWVNDSKWPKKYFKEVTDEEFTDHYDVLQSRLIEAGFPETVTITRMGTPNSSGNIRNGSAIEGWSGGNAEGNHYGMDTTVYVSKVPRKNIIGVGSLEEGEFFYINDGVITTTRA